MNSSYRFAATSGMDAAVSRESSKNVRPHVALVGFMGAGKSTVGRRLAKRGRRLFIDLDEAIEAAAGEKIAEIFRSKGEVGFRALERRVLREALAAEEPVIIATGGGTFADPSMRKWLQETCRSVFLRTSVQSILHRIGDGEQRQKRPLLMGPDARSTIDRLHSARLPAYEECDLTVDTDGRSPEEVVAFVERLLSASDVTDEESAAESSLAVDAAQGEYPVIFGDGDVAWTAAHISRIAGQRPLLLISDSNVAALHADPLLARLRSIGHTASLHVFAAGETNKHLGTVEKLYDDLLRQGVQRRHVVVAVGGGVVGDIAGFVAATILRGIDFIQVPTTTLAAVDSSVGGKTGFNSPRGKNLIGAFHAPIGVVACLGHLRTLPISEHRAGLVEAVKMAAAFDSDLFADIVAQAKPLLAMEPGPLIDVLRRAVAIKAEVVAADEREQGIRAVLNVGHTIGHAIESGEEFAILHGEAVGLGMLAEAQLGQSLGVVTDQQAAERIRAALSALGIPWDWRRRRVDLEALRHDKKAEQQSVRMPFVDTVGSYVLRDVQLTAICAFVAGGRV